MARAFVLFLLLRKDVLGKYYNFFRTQNQIRRLTQRSFEETDEGENYLKEIK